MTKDGFL
jgi:hypothetical protein